MHCEHAMQHPPNSPPSFHKKVMEQALRDQALVESAERLLAGSRDELFDAPREEAYKDDDLLPTGTPAVQELLHFREVLQRAQRHESAAVRHPLWLRVLLDMATAALALGCLGVWLGALAVFLDYRTSVDWRAAWSLHYGGGGSGGAAPALAKRTGLRASRTCSGGGGKGALPGRLECVN